MSATVHSNIQTFTFQHTIRCTVLYVEGKLDQAKGPQAVPEPHFDNDFIPTVNTFFS